VVKNMLKYSIEKRVELYNKAFPKYPKLVFDKGWAYGVWMQGNNYKGSGYYGAYPPQYIRVLDITAHIHHNILSESLPCFPIVNRYFISFLAHFLNLQIM
jgi:hypothetical protein